MQVGEQSDGLDVYSRFHGLCHAVAPAVQLERGGNCLRGQEWVAL